MSHDEKSALRAMRKEWLANVAKLFGSVQTWHIRFVKRCKPQRLAGAIADQRERLTTGAPC